MEKKKKSEGKEEERRSPERDSFQMQIDPLKRQLEKSDVQLQQQREALADVRSRLESETDSQQACVSHLKRVLAFETDRRLEVQEKWQTLKDQSELVERRALDKFATSEKSREAAESQFLQQKLELEGKLSLLEELRLKRNSQLVHLKKVEQALEKKTATLRKESREEDMRQVDGLLKRREEFLKRCRQIRDEWREAFQLRMPVHAKKQLEENVRLREIYDRTTERLLRVQEQNRNLKVAEKSVELQEEIQTSAEDDAGERGISQEKRLRRLLSARDKLRPRHSPESLSDASRKDVVEPIQERFEDGTETDDRIPEQRDGRRRDASSSEDGEEPTTVTDEEAAKRKRESIAEMAAERCRLRDRRDEATALLQDQSDYTRALEEGLEASSDENGLSMSAVLRAKKILETRSGRRGEETDFDLLQQIRFGLDLASDGF